jgi:PAS domain S-box-containing protein
MRTVARVYLCAGVGLTVVYVLAGGIEQIYEALGVCAAVAIVVGVIRNRPAARAGWLALALSQALLGVGDLIYFNAFGDLPPFPSVADAFYLMGLLVFGVALVLLVASWEYGRDLMSYADALVVATAVGLLAWSALFSGSLGVGADLERVVSVGYPVLEVGLLAALLRVFFVRGDRTWSYAAVAIAVALLILSDGWYVIPALTHRYVAGTWRDSGWLLAYTLAAVASLHPSMRTFDRPRSRRTPLRRIILLGLSVAGVAVAAILQQALTGHVHIYALAGCGAGAALFVAFRVAGLIRELERATAAAQESEQRFRLVFERSPIGISVGSGGVMMETNVALQRMLGYTGEELSRMHYTDVTHPDDRSLAVQHELDESTRDAFSIDKRYVRKDGSELDAHVHVALDVDNGIGISLIEDVSRRRELEEQLRQAQKMEAIGKLAGGIAHDFNNLMTAVIGYSDLIQRQFERGDPRSEKVTAIRDAAVRASDLTRQLLAFGRRQTLQADDVDLREVVDRMDTLLRRLIGEDIRLETVFGFEPVIVRADPTQLEQVVMNLAVNARDAMPGGGLLTIAVLSDGLQAVLSMADNGSGMTPETRARIFEPFFTTKGIGEGSGLGLATVHGIVGQSGGTIQVDTEPWEGTIFTVRFPLAHAEGAALPELPALATLS